MNKTEKKKIIRAKNEIKFSVLIASSRALHFLAFTTPPPSTARRSKSVAIIWSNRFSRSQKSLSFITQTFPTDTHNSAPTIGITSSNPTPTLFKLHLIQVLIVLGHTEKKKISHGRPIVGRTIKSYLRTPPHTYDYGPVAALAGNGLRPDSSWRFCPFCVSGATKGMHTHTHTHDFRRFSAKGRLWNLTRFGPRVDGPRKS